MFFFSFLLLGLLALLVLYSLFTYNRMVVLKNRIQEAWSDIDVQLKRRNSLIPNLVASVKGYMKHEKDLLTKVTELRSKIEKTNDKKELSSLDNQLRGALRSLQIAVENYPQLKANENVLKLQEELSNTEDKIAYSRRFYNQTVLSFNNKIKTFPGVLFARMFNFTPEEFFEASEEERKDVKVEL